MAPGRKIVVLLLALAVAAGALLVQYKFQLLVSLPLNHATNHEGVARTEADRARICGKARGAAPPADGKVPPINGRRAETKTIEGRP